MNDQLTLDVFLRTDKVFENFVIGQNKLLVQNLSNVFSADTGFFIWGNEGVGKSHLLHAVSYFAQQHYPESSVVFLPMDADESFPPEILEGLESCKLVCIDDLDSVLGDVSWEQSLFHLMNRLKDSQSELIVSSSVPLARLKISLPDLKTRLSQLLNFEVLALDDEGRKKVLEQRSYEKGMRIESDVINYVVSRGPRNMSKLMALLDLLETETLKEKRPVTIPFLKRLVNW